MLYLIGLGLSKDDLSLKALAAIKKCKEIYLEAYTSAFPYTLKELEKVIGKKITTVEREFVEECNSLLDRAKKKNVALIIYGDPLIATTHITILTEAKKRKIKVEVIHNISVINAITETGLEAYKFGKIASIPKWQENFKPTSFFDVFLQNKQIDAHTLFLFDIGLELKEAISYLLKAAEAKGLKDFRKINCIACSCLGTPKQKIAYTTAEKIANQKLKSPLCLIIPAKLHFAEENSLKKFSI